MADSVVTKAEMDAKLQELAQQIAFLQLRITALEARPTMWPIISYPPWQNPWSPWSWQSNSYGGITKA